MVLMHFIFVAGSMFSFNDLLFLSEYIAVRHYICNGRDYNIETTIGAIIRFAFNILSVKEHKDIKRSICFYRTFNVVLM